MNLSFAQALSLLFVAICNFFSCYGCNNYDNGVSDSCEFKDEYESKINNEEDHEHVRYCPNNDQELTPSSMLDVDCQCSQYRPGALAFDKNLADITIEDVIDIKKIVNKYGVIILSNATLTDDDDLLHFTRLFGEMIPLPSVFTKQAHESEYIGVITNIFANGTVDPDDRTAGYWHNDGDFWYVFILCVCFVVLFLFCFCFVFFASLSVIKIAVSFFFEVTKNKQKGHPPTTLVECTRVVKKKNKKVFTLHS